MLGMMGDNKKIASIIVSHGDPSEKMVESGHEYSYDEGLEDCARQMIDAINSRDPKRLVSCLKSAFATLEAMEESEHEGVY